MSRRPSRLRSFLVLPWGSMPVASSVSPDIVREQKDMLRKRMREERARLSPGLRASCGREASTRVLASGEAVGLDPRQAAATVVAAYWPVGAEADCAPLLTALDELGFLCSMPVVVAVGLPLAFRAWRPGDAMVSGPLGTRQPPVTAPERRPRILIVPLLAFDRHGGRLGQGGGYYDRTLAALRQEGPVAAIGFALALQEVAAVPATAGDERLDWVVTERELVRCAPRSGEGPA